MNAGSWVARRRPIAVETASARHASGPRFERFAAAMQAMPPPSEQVLPEAGGMPLGAGAAARPSATSGARPSAAAAAPARPAAADPTPGPFRPTASAQEEPPPAADSDTTASAPDAVAAAATMVPRRSVTEDGRRTRGDVPWLGIGSWLLLCGALFASLVGWPDQIAVDRLTSIWSNGDFGAILGRTPAEEPNPVQATPLPNRGQSAMAPGREPQGEAQPPIEAVPVPAETSGETAAPADPGPPVPRFKPRVDRVAAEFSSAFFEIGERLQREGDFDAAMHMRRQGSNLDPWKVDDSARQPSG